jgi:hypothetical protein
MIRSSASCRDCGPGILEWYCAIANDLVLCAWKGPVAPRTTPVPVPHLGVTRWERGHPCTTRRDAYAENGHQLTCVWVDENDGRPPIPGSGLDGELVYDAFWKPLPDTE